MQESNLVQSKPQAGSRMSQSSQDNWSDDWDESEEAPIEPISRARAEQLFGARAMQDSPVTPFKVVRWQALVTILATLLWSVLGKADASHSAAISAFLGGLLCVVPSAMFAMRLKVQAQRIAISSLVVGEAMKVLATIVLFTMVAYLYKEVQWGPLLLTYVLALKVYWLALIVK